VLSLLAIPLTADAQECLITLSGRVLDDHERTPLEYTSVLLVESGRGTIADSLGRYRLEGLCPGTYTLQASHVGCDPVVLRLTLSADTVVDLFPEHHIEMLEAITATAFRVSEAPSQTRSELRGRELERLRGRSLAEMTSEVAGVDQVRTGPGIAKPMIHGLSGNRILLVQHGLRQEGQQWGQDHAPEIDPTVAGSITVIKGAEGVRYGPDALGGVILVTPSPLPRVEGMGGTVRSEVRSNGLGGSVSATLQGGLRKEGWGWRATGSAKLLGDAHSPRYNLSNTGLREGGLSLQAGYMGNHTTAELYYSLYTAEFGILRAAHIGNLTDLQAALQADQPWFREPFTYALNSPRQGVTHHLVKAETSRELDHLWTLKGRYGLQVDGRREYDIRRGDRSDRPALDLTLASQQLDLSVEHRSWKHFRGAAGITGQYQANANDPGTGVRPLVPNYALAGIAAWATERYIRDRFELEAGIRYDRRDLEVLRADGQGGVLRDIRHFPNLNASVGGLFRPAPRWTVTLNAGSAYRAPGVHELFSEGLHHATASIEQGDPTMGTEKGMKAIASVRYEAPRASFEASGYLHRIDGFILLRPEQELQLTIRGAFPLFRYVQTDARIRGVDAGWRIDLLPWLEYAGQGSLLWGDDLGAGIPLFGMPPFRLRHGLKAHREALGIWRELEVQLGAAHIARQFRAPDTDLSPAPAGYDLANLSLGASLRGLRLEAGADNLFDAAYRSYLDRLRYFADAPGRNLWLRASITF
jgi:iron complex outermembrane receptor protein